jgi:hypothetical protein
VSTELQTNTKKKEGPLTLELQNNKIIKKGINGVPRRE